MEHAWNPMTVHEAAQRFARFDVDWWVAGGVAIDLFVGWETRHHDDLDIEMFRHDREVLFDVFAGWGLFTANGGVLSPWVRGHPVERPVFGIWGRAHADAPWSIEIMLADGDGDRWMYRRDNDISLRRQDLTRTKPDGIRYCTPEVQLLYKSKDTRQKDDADMATVLHRLTHTQRQWLADAIVRGDHAHPWVDLVNSANEAHHE